MLSTERVQPAPQFRGATARFQPGSWEYKVAITFDLDSPASPEAPDDRLQHLFKNGWIFVGGERGIYYLKRPKR
jgi:hypothetical protein